MISLTRSYPAGVDAAALQTLHDDIVAQLGANGWSIPGGGYYNLTPVNSTYAGYDAPIFDFSSNLSISSDDWDYNGAPALPITNPCHVDIAFDAAEAWMWIALIDETANTVSIRAFIGLNRHPSDMYPGNQTLRRFGTFYTIPGTTDAATVTDGIARVQIAGGTFDDGTQFGKAHFHTFSPLTSSKRPAGSPLPRMIAPLFIDPVAVDAANAGKRLAAAMPGEINCVMRATDGYAMGEEAVPNWHVYGDAATGFFALKRNTTLTAF